MASKHLSTNSTVYIFAKYVPVTPGGQRTAKSIGRSTGASSSEGMIISLRRWASYKPPTFIINFIIECDEIHTLARIFHPAFLAALALLLNWLVSHDRVRS